MDKQLEEHRILRIGKVSEMTGVRKSTIYSKVADGSFPEPIRLGARSVGWRLSDIVAWLQAPERRWDPSEVR